MARILVHLTHGPEHPTRAALAFLAAAGTRFYLSGMSSKARDLTQEDIAGKPAEFATPEVLVRLAVECDRTFTY